MSPARSYYEILGVRAEADEQELKRAYRKLARELHPDANGGDPEAEARFKEVTVAYETLRDPERRRRYDLFGADGPRAAAGPSDPFGGGLGDIFEAFFGGGGGGFGAPRRSGPRRGDDIEVVVELRFEEAVFGAERPVSLRGPVACGACGGSGAAPGTQPTTCAQCSGTGQVRRVRQSILGQVVTTTDCPRCQGIGEVIEQPCRTCHGEGRLLDERTVEVEIPPGVDDGTTLRVTGAGGAPARGGVNGDLYVHLRVARHERFERSGSDLVTVLHLSMAQAALGAECMIETLDGAAEAIAVPPGTQSGKVVRLRGKGVPFVRGRGRGDLHVQLVVDTPTELSKDQEQLLRQLAALRGEEVAPPNDGGFLSRLRSSLG